jgi:hypothetical protein
MADSSKRAIAALAVLAESAALACPACAGREDGGMFGVYAMGVMILFPFAVSLVGWRVLRRLNQDLQTESSPPVEVKSA